MELPEVKSCGSEEKCQEDDCWWERGDILPKIVAPFVRLKLTHIVYVPFSQKGELIEIGVYYCLWMRGLKVVK